MRLFWKEKNFHKNIIISTAICFKEHKTIYFYCKQIPQKNGLYSLIFLRRQALYSS